MPNRATDNHQTLEIAQADYRALAADSFLTDRKAAGTIANYRDHLKHFTGYCDGQAATQIRHLTPDFLRRYLLALAEAYNPGGVHAFYRILRAFPRWVEAEEVMPPEWRNPIHNVKPPKVPENILEPVPCAFLAERFMSRLMAHASVYANSRRLRQPTQLG